MDEESSQQNQSVANEASEVSQDHDETTTTTSQSSENALNVEDVTHVKRRWNKKTFIISSAIIIVAIVAGVFIYLNQYTVKQKTDVIEYGDNLNLAKTLEYDSSKIKSISIADAGGYSTNAIGDYVVTFSITDQHGKAKEKQFTYHVTDTVAPTLTAQQNTIYISMGDKFVPKDYITVNDKCNNCDIKCTGNYDTGKAGTYSLQAIATDKSGNTSKPLDIKLIVEDRGTCDIRNAKFGDSEEIVKRYEKLKNSDIKFDGKSTDNINNVLTYETQLNSEDAYLQYYFNAKDQLYAVAYTIIEPHTDYSIYLSSYSSLTDTLISKYGQPTKKVVNKGNLYNYCSTEAEALQLGQVQYLTTWDLSKMSIGVYMYSDNSQMNYALNYESKNYSGSTSTKDI